jgi:cation diffusion facilitator family transporter
MNLLKMFRIEQLEPRHYFWMSTATAIVTIILKTTAWWITGSMGLLSDAMESFVNLAGATFALWMITIAKVGPDEDHPLGHTKAEYFSSGFEGILIFGAAAAIVWSASHRLFTPQPLESVGLGLVLSSASTGLNLVVALTLRRAAIHFRSIALEGGSRHLMTDVWTTAGVIIGVVLVGVTGWLWLDAVVAILVGLHILSEGWKLVRTSADGLMDAALPPDEVALIEDALRPYAGRGIGYKNLRTRRAGAAGFVYIDVLVPPTWNIVQTHDLLDEIESSIRQVLPEAHVLTHPEPAMETMPP